MFSAGQIAGIRRPPPAEAPGHGLPNGVEPLVNYIRNLRSGAANNDRENVAEIRSGARSEAPVQQPAQDGFLSPSLRPGINSNTVGDVEALWKQSVVYTSTISSSANRTHPLGVEIHLPEWLPPQLHDEYLRAWEKTVEEKLVYFEENPLTWLGIEEPLKKYKTFPDRKTLEQWFEIEAQNILPRFIRKTQELQAGECFVSPEEREIFHDVFGEPQFRLSAKWRDALHGADADLTPSSLESIERKTAEHQKFLDDAELMRRPDENVFEWNFRVQQVVTQRAFSKVAASFKLSGALGAVMSAGGAGPVGAAQKQAPELRDEEKAQAIAAAEKLFAVQQGIAALQAELRVALTSPNAMAREQVATWRQRVQQMSQSMDFSYDMFESIVVSQRNYLAALDTQFDSWQQYSTEPTELEEIQGELLEILADTVVDAHDGLAGIPVAPGANDGIRLLIMDDGGWGAPMSVQHQADGSALLTWRREITAEQSPFNVQDLKHQVRLANIGADVVRDEQTAEGWELAIRITGEYRSPADALRNVWGEVGAVENSTQSQARLQEQLAALQEKVNGIVQFVTSRRLLGFSGGILGLNIAEYLILSYIQQLKTLRENIVALQPEKMNPAVQDMAREFAQEALALLDPILTALHDVLRTPADSAEREEMRKNFYRATAKARDALQAMKDKFAARFAELPAMPAAVDPSARFVDFNLATWNRAGTYAQNGRVDAALSLYRSLAERLDEDGDRDGASFVRARIAELEAQRAK